MVTHPFFEKAIGKTKRGTGGEVGASKLEKPGHFPGRPRPQVGGGKWKPRTPRDLGGPRAESTPPLRSPPGGACAARVSDGGEKMAEAE